MAWVKVTVYGFEGSSIELHPEHGSGLWWVINSKRPGRALTSSALPLKEAKRVGEFHAKKIAVRNRRARGPLG